MARTIDPTANPSAEDVEYVSQRPWLVTEWASQGHDVSKFDVNAVVDEDDTQPRGWNALTVDQLKEEIAKRNSELDDDEKMPVTGKKAELVSLLEADDRAIADS